MKRTKQHRPIGADTIATIIIIAGLVTIILSTILSAVDINTTAQQLKLAQVENQRLAAKCQNLESQLAEIIHLERKGERLANELAQLREAVTLEPWPIPLEPELQTHTYKESIRSRLPPEIVLAIMEHESRYLSDVPDNINRNGTRDRGLMQINEVNWELLRNQYGLDVSDPRDNITAGMIILSVYLQDYPMEQALAAYAAGETGMLRGEGAEFAANVMSGAKLCLTPEKERLRYAAD